MKTTLKLITIFIIIVNSQNILHANDQNERLDKLTKNLRCLICQGQSVYDSQSDFALSVRDLIIKKIDDGDNDQEIYSYLKNS